MRRHGAFLAFLVIGITSCGGSGHSTPSAPQALIQVVTNFEAAVAADNPAGLCKSLLPDARVILFGWVSSGHGHGVPCPVSAGQWLRESDGSGARLEERDWNEAKNHLKAVRLGGTQSDLVYGAEGTGSFEFVLDRMSGAGWLIALQVQRGVRHLAGIAAAASGGDAATAASTPGRDKTGTRLADAMPTCRASQLKITMGYSFAGLGTAGANIRFINRSTVSCELYGWPKLIAETSAPSSAHTRAQDWPGPEFADVSQVGVPTVILKPNQRADAIFDAADHSPNGAPCGPARRSLRVTPPENTRSVAISAWIPYLGQFLPSCSPIRLSPVLASTSVYDG